MFSIKIFSKFVGVEILGSSKFSPVSDSTFWKMMSFETKWIAFFGAKLRYFLPRLRSPAKAMRYTDETLSLQGSAIRLRNIDTDYTGILNINVTL